MDASTNGPVVVVLLAIVAALATVFTALGPTFVEIVKNRGGRKPSTPTLPPVPAPVAPPVETTVQNQSAQTAFNGLSMVEQAVMDYRAQRDDAMRRYYDISEQLDRAQKIISEQAVIIARLEAALSNSRNATYYGRHEMPGPQNTPGWGP